MVKVSSTIKIDRTAIDRLERAQVTALEMTAEALRTEVVQAQVIPRRSGHLQNDATFVDRTQSKLGRVSIVSSTPYARRLYYHPEYNFYKVENPNAGGHWFSRWLPGGENETFTSKTFGAFFKRLGGV